MKELKFGPPVYLTKIEEELRVELLNQGKLQKEDAKDTLVGHINDEKSYNKILTNKFGYKILTYINEYINTIKSDRKIVNESYKLFLNSLWINRQKAGEHNPPHKHSGGQISFVIYLDFPDEIKNESPFSKQSYTPGAITFFYGNNTNVEGNTEYKFPTNLLSPIDIVEHTPNSGEMIIFPSYLIHYVSSFYTENIERISVSGNISIIETNNKNLI